MFRPLALAALLVAALASGAAAREPMSDSLASNPLLAPFATPFGVPPFEETREYVRRVTARYGNAPHPFDARISAPSAQLANIRARR